EEQVKKEIAMGSMAWKTSVVAGCVMTLMGCTGMGSSQEAARSSATDMTFFVTSIGPGKGGDLGGLEGADRHCQKLAASNNADKQTWRAYLSTQGARLDDKNFINARDRIGSGPWQNANGVVIAR